MKKLVILFLLSCSISVYAQTKVAVYVVDSNVDDGIRKIFGSEMASAIGAYKDYQAIERTSIFLDQLSKEHGIGVDQLVSVIGKKVGVDNVCVVDITSFQSSYYVQARLLDVTEAAVLSTAREISSLSTIEEIVSVAERLASKLVGEDLSSEQVEMDYSTIGKMSEENAHLHLISIDNTEANTVLSFKYCMVPAGSYYISSDTYLYDKAGNKCYHLIDTRGITIAPKETKVAQGIHTFSLLFEKLPDTTYNIDFIEPDDGWCIYDIVLKPYVKQNYYLFVDESKSDYKNLSQQYLQQIQQKEKPKSKQDELGGNKGAYGNLANVIEDVFTYELKVMNTKLFPRMIWIGDRFIGTVKGNSEATFKVATAFYGSAKSVQSEGYVFYPSTESFYIQKPYSGQLVIWIIK